MMKAGQIALVLGALAYTGCASSPDSIESRYVSPVTYQNWTCDQILDEKRRLNREVARVSGLQRENANADVAMATIGVILFWPLLFGMAATKDRKHELGQLKGEYEAVDLSARMKQCVPPPPTPGAPQNVAATGAFDGTYSGRGKADSWCQTPSLILVVKGADLSGELSEVATQAATSAVTGTVLGTGAFTLTLKPSGPNYAAGEYEGKIAADAATVDIGPVGGASKCTYRFEVKKRAAG